MKNILRNFLITLTRFKLASALNIAGLAVAFAAFLIIMMQTYWEFTYNHSVDGYERIVQFEQDLMFKGTRSAQISRPLGEAIGEGSAVVTNYVLLRHREAMVFKVFNDNNELQSIVSDVNMVGDGFIDCFSLKKVSGDFARFSDPSAVVVSRSYAMRMFGTTDIANRQIFGNNDTLFVAAVFEDFADNCTLKNGIYVNMAAENKTDQSSWSYSCFFKLTSAEAIVTLFDDIVEMGRIHFAGEDNPFAVGKDLSLRLWLLPMTDLYFNSVDASGNYAMSLLLLTIAFLIIAIAMINFINFFMALVPMRIKAVNIHKIFGTPVASLRANIVGESVGTVVLAYLLSLLILVLLQHSAVGEYVSCSIEVAKNTVVIVGTAILAVVIGLIAGLYPAYYITKFPPMMVIGGGFGRSKTGVALRSILVGIQYVISIALIVGAIFIALQTSFMQSHNMGYNRDRLLTVDVNAKIAENPETFLDLLRKNPDIIDVSYSGDNIVNVGMSWGREFNGESILLISLPVSWDYPEFMDIKLVAGRYFTRDDTTKPSGTMIVNETAAKKYKIKVGDFINGHSEQAAEVVGIAKDFNFRSTKYTIEPIVLYEFGSEGWYTPSVANIRITPTASYAEVSEYIASAIKQLHPATTDDLIEIHPFDQTVEKLYRTENDLASIISIFSVVAILISLVGVFGLVVFEVQYRRREIALRKIHGATVASVLTMINRRFIIITAISAAIAIPLIYIGVWYWLQSFALQTTLSWWVGVVAVLLVWGITVAIVTVQTLRTARESPIRSLRSN